MREIESERMKRKNVRNQNDICWWLWLIILYQILPLLLASGSDSEEVITNSGATCHS